MTSDPYRARRVFVWTWLPGESEPVVAGAVDRVEAGRLDFTYARSYLDNENAMSLYAPELPLRRGGQEPLDGLRIAACLKDATPDSWGERVIGNRMGSDDQELSIETYMLQSGSNRFGAIDFQESASKYVPRLDTASLDELFDAAEKVLAGVPLNSAIGDALMNGTAIGGATRRFSSATTQAPSTSPSCPSPPTCTRSSGRKPSGSSLRGAAGLTCPTRESSSRWAGTYCSSNASIDNPAGRAVTSSQD